MTLTEVYTLGLEVFFFFFMLLWVHFRFKAEYQKWDLKVETLEEKLVKLWTQWYEYVLCTDDRISLIVLKTITANKWPFMWKRERQEGKYKWNLTGKERTKECIQFTLPKGILSQA